jgi:hypothetical protein
MDFSPKNHIFLKTSVGMVGRDINTNVSNFLIMKYSTQTRKKYVNQMTEH